MGSQGCRLTSSTVEPGISLFLSSKTAVSGSFGCCMPPRIYSSVYILVQSMKKYSINHMVYIFHNVKMAHINKKFGMLNSLSKRFNFFIRKSLCNKWKTYFKVKTQVITSVPLISLSLIILATACR